MVGGRRRSIIAGLSLVMLLGIAVYFRLWTIDYNISSDDTELLRQQFDLANREAMDESAEWRLKYDKEVNKATKCTDELRVIKESFQKLEDASSSNQKLATLKRENKALLERVEILRRELEAEKSKCNPQYMN
ncbi:Acyl-CoA-binding domain protein [Quillaja saponaria]|uniref:Acyl-CoA-binding domain protein n=1 Tax=Quillaja saponaria TaxID=32244 RepID=A0AAD7VIM0_QUISA|nr:Acyl-CoA-binding domain protein [Quillaja saponaria]KAJ7976960.1 Acyl-CoA-binding domain protein [Quillaja saponaria]